MSPLQGTNQRFGGERRFTDQHATGSYRTIESHLSFPNAKFIGYVENTMEFKIDKKTFLAELSKVCPLADRKNPMPILSNVLITTEGKKIRLSATNLYLAITCTVAAEIKKPGHAAIPGETLLEIVRNLPNGKISIVLDGEGKSVKIQSKQIKLKVNVMPGKEFPALPSPPKIKFGELSIESFSKLLTYTYYAISEDDSRKYLMSLRLECGPKLVLAVATDGYRLSKAEYKPNKKETPITFEMALPLKGVVELRRLIESYKPGKEKDPNLIRLVVGGTNAFFKQDNLLLSVRLSAEKFPRYDNIIPKTFNKQITISREAFADALKRIKLFAGEGSYFVKLALSDGVLSITSQSDQIGTGVERIKIDYHGEALEVGFSAKYLLDILKALPEDEVTLGLNSVTMPVGILSKSKTNFVGIVMPLTG